MPIEFCLSHDDTIKIHDQNNLVIYLDFEYYFGCRSTSEPIRNEHCDKHIDNALRGIYDLDYKKTILNRVLDLGVDYLSQFIL